MMTVKAIGGDKLLKRFQKMGKAAEEEFEDVVVDTAEYARRQAMGYLEQRVKTGSGHLKRSMYVDLSSVKGGKFAVVGNKADYAGYVEFGTGGKVRVPAEFAKMAQQVKSRPSKSFEEGLQAIRDWCGYNGIDKSLAWVIFMSILGKRGRLSGTRPKPFMYPAYLDAKKYMRRRSEEAIKRISKIK